MRRLFISLITLSIAVIASAVVIDNTAGNLEQNATDHTTTSLTITGTIDARDFKFIADSLTSLEELDLTQVQIVAYENRQKALVGTTFSFPGDELPTLVLMGTNIKTIKLPTTLKSIGAAALAGCSQLSDITLPQGLESIGDYAFNSTSITQVTLPETVVNVGEGAWSHCPLLTTATFNLEQVPNNAFMGDTVLNDLTLGNKVTTIGRGAFNGCTALQTIKVESDNTIASIGAEAFIGAGAGAIALNSLTALKEIGDWAFASSGITSVALPQGLETLGKGAFYNAQNLTNITLPKGLDTIPQYAFAGNTVLAGTVVIPDGVEVIADYAFYNCDNTSIFSMPASISHIANWAMAGMIALDTINIATTVVPALGDSVWAGINQSAVKLNTVSNTVADLFREVEQWKEFHILHIYLLGDANGDGILNVVDINALVAYILGQPISPFIFDAADVNQDGIINVTDINGIISYLLNGGNDYIRKVNRRVGNTYKVDTK